MNEKCLIALIIIILYKSLPIHKQYIVAYVLWVYIVALEFVIQAEKNRFEWRPLVHGRSV